MWQFDKMVTKNIILAIILICIIVGCSKKPPIIHNVSAKEFTRMVDRRNMEEKYCRIVYCATKIVERNDTLILGKKELGRIKVDLFITPKKSFNDSQLAYIDSVRKIDTMFVAMEKDSTIKRNIFEEPIED